MLARHKGKIVRFCLKAVWSKAATRRTGIGYEAVPGGTSEQKVTKSIPIKRQACKSGGCAVKVVGLTSGDLGGVSVERLGSP